MKRIFYILLSLLMLGLPGCSQYALQEDLEALQKEVQDLKALCEQLNNDVAALNVFMEAYNGCKMVTHVVETSYGWTIYFNDDTWCDLRHGKDGENGEKGEQGNQGEKGDTPVIGVAQYTDGLYYWTLNGEFMLVDGKMIPTTGEDGKDAVVPSFQVVDGNMLQVSYDNGKTWSDVGKVEGVTTVPSAITDVNETDDDVTFTLADGGELVMQKYKALKITVGTPVENGNSYSVDYNIAGGDEAVQVVCVANDGWKASISRLGPLNGTISLTAPETWEDASVLVFAYSAEQIAMTVIYISQDKIQVAVNEYPVGAEGSTFVVPVMANFDPVVKTSADWISAVDTKAMAEYRYSVVVEPNGTGADRTASINFYREEGGLLMGSIAIVQSALPSIVPVELSVSADLSGSIWQETSVAGISISSDGELDESGNKTLDVVSGKVTVLPCSSYDVLFTLANGQAFHYVMTELPSDGNVTLSGLDALVGSGAIVPEYYGLAGEDGTARANCYIVLDGGYYSFPADYLNDGTTAIDAVSADWLWSEGNESLVSGVSLDEDRNVCFCVQANTKGNAVIATKSVAGDISWSWHIWMLQENPAASVHYARSAQSYAIMNYHLGATTQEATADANGLYYQWGRKDPFPRANTIGSSSESSESGQFGNLTLAHVENTSVFKGAVFAKTANSTPSDKGISDIEYSVQNPTSFISAAADSPVPADGVAAVRTWLSTSSKEVAYRLWNNSHDGTNQDLNAIKSTDKTNYDPCPAGFIVPSSARMVWHNGSSWKFENLKFAVPFNISCTFTNPSDGTSAYYPACGARSDGKLQQLGNYGNTWASWLQFNASNGRLMGQMMRLANPTYDDNGAVTAIGYVGSGTDTSSWAYPVRCVRIAD